MNLIRNITRVLSLALGALVGLIAFFSATETTSAQRYREYNQNYEIEHKPRRPRPGRGNRPDRDYDRDDDRGGRGNRGRFIMRLAPQILDELDDYEPRRPRPRPRYDDYEDDDYEDEPVRRRKPRRPNVTRKKPKKARPRRVTVIPPIPPTPPARLTPPPPAPPASLPPSPRSRSAALSERPRFKEAEVVVVVRGAEPDNIANQLAQDFNLVLLETLNFALLETSRAYRFRIPDNRPVATVAASMATVQGVGFAAPNSYYWLQGDAAASALSLQYALPKMRVPAAQRIASGRGMSVAVIDSGVDRDHPALKSANLTIIDAVKEGVKGPDKHGTAIAGIIAANGDMVGIAPSAKIIAVRAFAPERLGQAPVTTATTLARAVDQAFAQGARIFNMSFAGDREPLLIEMIDAAAARGAVFVAAAGNEGPDAPPAYPAAHDKVIAITATDETDALYDQANRGGYVFAAAPGVDIFAPVTGQGFDYLSGTSFAAAHVTGVIALLMERNPNLSADAVRNVLIDAARDLGAQGQDSEFGAGLTDAYGSLQLVDKQ